MDDDDPTATGLAAANRFFDGLLAGDLDALQDACAPGSILWINLTERERPLEASLPGGGFVIGNDVRLTLDVEADLPQDDAS